VRRRIRAPIDRATHDRNPVRGSSTRFGDLALVISILRKPRSACATALLNMKNV
jgi:hypothetical protein